MGNIVLLDELTINKIAAGEVIERPASVIKEMVENSIDAGASNITVEIQNGGISYIRITDNGKGISEDDMEFAFERHATSKIRVAEDIENITSMGFRGEALASIAAIANVEMVSRTEAQEVGYKVVIEGGKILEKEEIGTPIGTSITVKNLFFNTPVRYKFLKKDFTETGYIEDIITRIALANPGISIKLINSGKTIISTSGNGDIEDVVYGIYGKDIREGIIKVNYCEGDVILDGVIGKAEIARSNRANQIFFVNNRYVKDKTLSAAAEQAYRGMLPIGKFPFIVLDVHIPPTKVDVNVHPAKLEVRFEEEQKIFKTVYNSIKSSLLQGNLVKDVKSETTQDMIFSNAEEQSIEDKFSTKKMDNISPLEMPKTNRFLNLFHKREDNTLSSEWQNNTLADIYSKKIKNEDNIESAGDESITENKDVSPIRIENENQSKSMSIPSEEQVGRMTELLNLKKGETAQFENAELNKVLQGAEVNEKFDEMYEKTFGNLPPTTVEEQKQTEIQTVEEIAKYENISTFENDSLAKKFKLVGIVFSTYIIIEIDEEMYILDQHAVHERINYEKVKESFYNQKEKDSQIMLLPDVITLTHKEMEIVKENVELFEDAGFALEEFGENTIKLLGVPNICINLDTKQLFLDILDEIDTVAITARKEKEEKFIATIACKASVKANMDLDDQEVYSLLEELLELPNPFTCPHGRPTAIKMSKKDIEKKFNRR
ncbi:MAG: DNA mismatch repair endonuclease MutL [Lachnospiraceae bacterium]|jgi:DNA mismatch repair protein MutL|nr:DNA mismatch repair endonuclease MutL [Lachnospiraceae bacterium]